MVKPPLILKDNQLFLTKMTSSTVLISLLLILSSLSIPALITHTSTTIYNIANAAKHYTRSGSSTSTTSIPAPIQAAPSPPP
ncbi:MAG TPA: hypothetical protein VE619_09545, partial [Nitrososphaeraceae archaeon]|nr:hypothetical protein [Nitrososphaeraceae archaeon]